jgi:hypothetical protein
MTPIQILEHLNTQWCPLDVRAKKQLKAEFHVDWDSSVMHITAFGLKFDKEQKQLELLGIVISNKDELQFYMKQIYASNMFDKKEMIDWENKPVGVKDDYNQSKLYFENLVKDIKTYTQNSGGTAAKQGYKSANMAADVGNKLQKYIQEIAIAAAAEKELAAKNQQRNKGKGCKNSRDDRADQDVNRYGRHTHEEFWQQGECATQYGQHKLGIQSTPIQLNTQHGSMLLVTRPSSSWRQAYKQNVLKEEKRSHQCHNGNRLQGRR